MMKLTKNTGSVGVMIVLVCLLLSLTSVASNDSAEVDWPWDGKNKTKPDNKNRTSACTVHKTCTECTNSSLSCHWCAHDQACHAKGSMFGCLEGVTCGETPHKKNHTDNSCSSHKNCSECALSSSVCHWCAHDQACHPVGSIHGCLTGVDCFSSDRCMRKEPEPISEFVFNDIGIRPMLILLALCSICMCCATFAFCMAGGVKGAYDDLAVIAATSGTVDVQDPTQAETSDMIQNENAPATEQDEEEAENGGPDDNYNLMEDDPEEEIRPLVSTTTSGKTQGSRHMRCLYNTCTVCYAFTVAFIVVFAIGSIRYFPKRPEYNVCSDEVAWKSIVDSMASMSAKAEFEILLSVKNPNHLDVALDLGRGSFKHKDVLVGTFVIPPVVVKGMSISDLMIIATLSPDKWEALSLSREYYRGRLVLDVATELSIRVPSLFNYTFEGSFDNIEVNVNEQDSREFCHCPDWNEAKNKTPHLFN